MKAIHELLTTNGFSHSGGTVRYTEWTHPLAQGMKVRVYDDGAWEYYAGEEDDGHGVHGSGATDLLALLASEWEGM